MAAMTGPLVVIFHQPPRDGEPPLTGLLAAARGRLVTHHTRLFRRAGAERVVVTPGREDAGPDHGSYGQRLADLVAEERPRHGIIVLGSGAVPLMRRTDAARLVAAASADGRHALTNNRFSSDVCAVSQARRLQDLPPLPTDNVLPRWLEEAAGYRVRELPGRGRLAIDLDTPLDLALLGLVPRAPADIRALAARPAGPPSRRTPRGGDRSPPGAAADGSVELSHAALAGAARQVPGPLPGRGARPEGVPVGGEHPPASIDAGPAAGRARPGRTRRDVAELADGALIDTRVLMADRLGIDEAAWPSAEDRFASDLLLPDAIADPWLAALTHSAQGASVPIQLGAHTLVGPGHPGAAGRPGGRLR